MRHRPDSRLKQVFGGMAYLVVAMTMALAGCEQQEEKVFDLEAPGVDVEVMESTDGSGKRVDVETGPHADHE